MRTLAVLLLFSSFAMAQGMKLFAAKCSVCHDPDGTEKRVGPGLKGAKDGTLPSGRPAKHDTILKQLNSGGGGMPVFKELLTDDGKEELIKYVLSL